jgi:hypothetical protein
MYFMIERVDTNAIGTYIEGYTVGGIGGTSKLGGQRVYRGTPFSRRKGSPLFFSRGDQGVRKYVYYKLYRVLFRLRLRQNA